MNTAPTDGSARDPLLELNYRDLRKEIYGRKKDFNDSDGSNERSVRVVNLEV